MSGTGREGGPHVATVMLNYNQYALTRDSLISLRKSRWEPHTVILVDNASSDGSAERLRGEFPEVHVLEPGENLGCAGGRNLGARAAIERGADYAFFLDNDTFIDEECISRLVAHLERDPSLGIVGAKAMRHPETEEVGCCGSVIRWERCVYYAVPEVPRDLPADGLVDAAWVPGTAWMVRSSLFGEVGFLDERYFIYFEDTDFSLRVRQKGLRTAMAPDAAIWHRQHSSLGVGLPSSAYYYARNRLLFFSEHSPHPVYSWWFLSSRGLAWVFRLLARGEGGMARAVLAGLRDAALGRLGRRPS